MKGLQRGNVSAGECFLKMALARSKHPSSLKGEFREGLPDSAELCEAEPREGQWARTDLNRHSRYFKPVLDL